MTYVRDQKRLEQIFSKATEPKYAPTGQIVPRLTWENHLEIEAIQDRVAMYKKRDSKWNWRAYLTAEELAILASADRAKAAWLESNKERAGIVNRAVQRAKHAARSPSKESGA